MTAPLYLPVKSCSACGQNHHQLVFWPYVRRQRDNFGTYYTHRATCPVIKTVVMSKETR